MVTTRIPLRPSTNQNHVVVRQPPLESIEVGSSASPPGQEVTETRGGVLKLSKVGLGTLEATERQLQHPGAADHGAGGRHHHCLLSTVPLRQIGQYHKSVEERRGREMAGLPQGGKPPLGFLFFKKPVFCFRLLTPLPLSGVKRYIIVYCLMRCLLLLLKPSRDQGASHRNML